MTGESGAIVRIEHCRQLRYCARGMRAFFERHGLDWQRFRAEGLPVEDFERTGDAMAIAAARLARMDHEGR